MFEHIRDIKDPEHPYSLEQLSVVSEDLVDVDDAQGHIRCGSQVCRPCRGSRCSDGSGGGLQAAHCAHVLVLMCLPDCAAHSPCRVQFTPTVAHCSLATLIGLCIRVKLLRVLPPRFKVDIKVGTGLTKAGLVSAAGMLPKPTISDHQSVHPPPEVGHRAQRPSPC